MTESDLGDGGVAVAAAVAFVAFTAPFGRADAAVFALAGPALLAADDVLSAAADAPLAA
jgi:hypothetical protein